MDVSRQNLYSTLPNMLSLAQHARFVAIDLEMSGISVHNAGSNSSITSPQKAYSQAKKAAEVFTIIEIGLTFIQYDEGSSQYSTKTFNIPLSPEMPYGHVPYHIAHGLTQRLDRIAGFSMSSLKFLKDNRFDLNKSFNDGCFYLGRHEEKIARQWVHSLRPRHEQPRNEKASNDDIDFSTLSTEYNSFYARARLTIEDMIVRPNRQGNTTATIHDSGFKDLTTLHLSLVMHLVREEFQQCKVLPPTTSPVREIRVQVTDESSQPEDPDIAQKLQQVEYIVGLRYLFEALAGGSLPPRIQQHWACPAQPQQGPGAYTGFNLNFDVTRCEEALRKSRPIVVGHNLFYDLVFIYRTFFGPLPDNLDDFLLEIHQLFPRIVDTKYLATRKPQGNSGLSYISLRGDSQTLLDEDSDTLAEMKGLEVSHPALLEPASKQIKLVPMPGENYSAREIHILPVWSDDFWAVYGNKTRVGGAGVVCFV
ncbi:hypothetical protein SLS62_010138 [Diatrype stigma]|uniref:Uncharacterized protein n=1 Tax=Diatrype stigma TaxID=117547 RepID=A0AAN9U9Z4_9PEZI